MSESDFMNRYSGAFGRPGTLQQDWRWLLSVGACCYLAVLGLRLSLWTLWDNPLLRVGDEFIMSTHDSYLWLAHARVAEFGDGRSLAYFTRLLHEYLGLGLGTIGFWGPAFLSSLVAIPCVLWGWILGGREGSVFAGLAGCLTPGFFARSKLGYYDTDLFTLLMPLLVAFWLAWWLRQRTGFRWTGEKTAQEPSPWLPFQVLAMALFTRFAGWWHHDIANYSALLFLLAMAIGVVFARKGQRPHVLCEGAIFLLAGIAGTAWGYVPTVHVYSMGIHKYVAAVVLLAALVAWWRVRVGQGKAVVSRADTYIALGLLCAAIVTSGILSGPLASIWSKLLLYLKPAATDVAGAAQQAGPIYPRVTQSIIEAKSIPLDVILERSAYYSWLGLAALVAVIPVLVARPLAVLLLPLVALSLLSFKMGTRFSMFGGAALMIFFGVAATSLVRAVLPAMDRGRALAIAGFMAVLAGCIVLPKYAEYRSLPPTPVLDKAHAEALVGLGERAPKDAVVWTWWDWGYATQYYAGLRTPIDGGRHSGKDMFPTAVALTTDSPLQANRLIRSCARFPQQDPSSDWAGMSGKDVQQKIKALATDTSSLPPVPKQYVAVSYKDIRIAKWIMFYGNWDVASGSPRKATVRRFGPGQMAVNLEIGGVMNRQGMKNAILSADMIDVGKAEHYEYPQNRFSPALVPQTPHLVFNMVAGETNFFDKATYNSMLVKLFTGDPESESIQPYFRLVADGLPFIRIYEVVQN